MGDILYIIYIILSRNIAYARIMTGKEYVKYQYYFDYLKYLFIFCNRRLK